MIIKQSCLLCKKPIGGSHKSVVYFHKECREQGRYLLRKEEKKNMKKYLEKK